MYVKNKICVKKQDGGGLVEVLIATALVGIMLHGAATLVNRATGIGTDQQLITIAVEQMRASLASDPDICTTIPLVNLPNGEILSTVPQGCNTTTPVQIGGVLVSAPTPIRLSVTHPSLGGQVAVGGTP